MKFSLCSAKAMSHFDNACMMGKQNISTLEFMYARKLNKS